MSKALLTLPLLVLALLPGSARAAPATATFVSGDASRRHEGTWEALREKGSVAEGDAVRTAKGARLELTLADGSVVRLDGDTEFVLKAAAPAGAAGQRFTGKLGFGRLWAKVNSVLGGQSHFDIETQNAVAGVRGTTFRVDAKRDSSALVRVYAGAVAVAGVHTPAPGHEAPPGHRKEVPGPKEVTKQQYEKLLQAMMQVRVSSAGELGEPEKFAQSDDAADSWVAFNQGRDGN